MSANLRGADEREEAEALRLAALKRYEILDTAPEQRFDDIVEIASQICGVPIALVSLVDERRQWFKAAVGLEVAETPREIAFCAHTIETPEVMVVQDATLDPRFSGNPLVTGDPRIQFYAGAPLVTAEGHALGTLCVLDHQARDLTESQRRALEALARQVVDQLELRRALERERRDQQHRRLLLDELRHRVKNTLATVQAIVSQALRSASSMAEARTSITDRLATLGHAHDILVAENWAGAPIAAVVQAATAALDRDAGRIRASGPDLDLSPRAALALSMALHELSTNAIKYGALSTPEGHVELTWDADPEGPGAQFRLRWREAGGPPVSPPQRRGFGVRLLHASAVGDLAGAAQLEYAPSGVVWALTSRLEALRPPRAADD